MLFNSLEFALFFLCVYTLYRVLPFRWQNRMLLLAGYTFYGWWDVRFLSLIAFSTTVDFAIGSLLDNPAMPKRERWTASLFLIGAVCLFLCPDWAAFFSDGSLAHLLDFTSLGMKALAGMVALVLVFNLLVGRIAGLEEQRRRRLLIICSVAVNLGFLGIFKYFNFFIDGAEELARTIGLDAEKLRLHVILPVGISFYTFQSLSYTIDVYRRRTTPTHRFWDFALFVAYFPPMVAGPIERARHLLPQLTRPRRIRLGQSADGVALILLGLFKKVAIADGLAPSVATVFGSVDDVSRGDVMLATLLFAVQILCDFSGYSDIARGVSKLLGIDLVVNFNLPYFSRNPSEFWRRWHISLSSWLRDYLYIPLGGNRFGAVRTYFNLMLTMLLGGLWHGAAWNFVLWGAYQGVLLSIHRAATRMRGGLLNSREATDSAHRLPRVQAHSMTQVLQGHLYSALSICLCMTFVCYGWLLFRATSWTQISHFTALLLGFAEGSAVGAMPRPSFSAMLGIPVLAALQFADFREARLESFRGWKPPIQGALYALLVVLVCMGTNNAPVQFIYFQF